MSYDLHLYRVEPGSSVEQAHHECCEHQEARSTVKLQACRPLSDSDRERAAALILEADPGLEVFRSADSVELTSPEGDEHPVTWSIYPTSCAVSWPYFSTPAQLAAVHQRVGVGLEALAAIGMRAFDPQMGKEMRSADLPQSADVYQWANQQAAAAIADRHGHRKRWWKFW
jgi:hypothetical protein